jgi:hypothetical protein
MDVASMLLQIRIRRLPEFTSVKISGPAALADMLQFAANFGEDHFRIGEAAAHQLKHLDRLASIVPAGQITRTSEKVARKQGLQLRVFTSMTEAIRWLCEPGELPPKS